MDKQPENSHDTEKNKKSDPSNEADIAQLNAHPEESQSPQKRKITTADKLKFAGLIVFILLVIAAGSMLIPYFEHFTTAEGRQELADIIKDAGIGGVGICLLLQFIQIVVAFIPGEVVQLVIGAIYGPLLGTIITATGALISSGFIFFIVRKLGTPFVEGMIGNKDSKILNFIQKGRRLNVLVFILFLIPGLPKDVFTYLFPLTKIRPANFLIIATLARIPGIAASAYIGNAAMQGDYTQAIIVGIIAGGLGLLGIIFNKQILGFIDKIEDRIKEKHNKNKAALGEKIETAKDKVALDEKIETVKDKMAFDEKKASLDEKKAALEEKKAAFNEKRRATKDENRTDES